jgi:hypothetical protein
MYDLHYRMTETAPVDDRELRDLPRLTTITQIDTHTHTLHNTPLQKPLHEQ